MVRKHAINSDKMLNPKLKETMQELRGGIHETAERQPIPERFKTVNCTGSPSVIIIDTETNKKTKVPLFAYSDVRKALNDLFQE